MRHTPTPRSTNQALIWSCSFLVMILIGSGTGYLLGQHAVGQSSAEEAASVIAPPPARSARPARPSVKAPAATERPAGSAVPPAPSLPPEPATPPVETDPVFHAQATQGQAPSSSAPARLGQGLPPHITGIDVRKMYEHVRHLSEVIGPRAAGSPAEKRTLDYLEREFRSYGYTDIGRQAFTPRGKKKPSYNLVANYINPNSPYWVVVGAHHDTVPGSRGANDNASGVAVMLEVARLLFQHGSAFNVTFVAFGAEEISHDGSEHFVATLPHALSGMINLDMVGVGPDFEIGSWGGNHSWLMNRCRDAARALGYSYKRNPTFTGKSDYAAFARNGIPIAIFDWDPDPNKHTERDRLSRINPNELMKRLEITARTLIAALGPSGQEPRGRGGQSRSKPSPSKKPGGASTGKNLKKKLSGNSPGEAPAGENLGNAGVLESPTPERP